MYRGTNGSATNNLTVVEATVDGTTYWGFIVQDLGSYQAPGDIYFDGGITNSSNFGFIYRNQASSVTTVTPDSNATSSKISATENCILKNEVHGNVFTTDTNGDISF